MQLTPSHLQVLADKHGSRSWSVPVSVDGVFPIVVDTSNAPVTYVFTLEQLAAFAAEVVATDRRPNPAHGAPMPPNYHPVA